MLNDSVKGLESFESSDKVTFLDGSEIWIEHFLEGRGLEARMLLNFALKV